MRKSETVSFVVRVATHSGIAEREDMNTEAVRLAGRIKKNFEELEI
jgi:hypothetical protein